MKNLSNIDANNLFLIDSILIEHSMYMNALKRLERCFRGALRGSEPICLAVEGESGTGKTTLLECYEIAHPKVRKPNGLEVPVLRVKVPSNPTVKGLVTELLYKLGDPLYDKGTEVAKTIRLRTLLLETKTRIIMLDEFQHFYDQGSEKIRYHLSNWLKNIIDELRIGLVVAGLPSMQIVVSTNEQLARRFQRPARLIRFNWSVVKDREEFIQVLSAFQENLKPFQFPKLDSEDMAFRMYCATGGLIGYVTKILREAISVAVDKKSKAISLLDLHRSHKNVMWDQPDIKIFPFSNTFRIDCIESALDLAKKVGGVAVVASKGHNRSRRLVPDSVSEVLKKK